MQMSRERHHWWERQEEEEAIYGDILKHREAENNRDTWILSWDFHQRSRGQRLLLQQLSQLLTSECEGDDDDLDYDDGDEKDGKKTFCLK
jgi:hypothetical protein